MRKIISILIILIFFYQSVGFCSLGDRKGGIRAPLRGSLAEEAIGFLEDKEPGVPASNGGFIAYRTKTIIDTRSFSMGRGKSVTRPENKLSLVETLDYLETHPNDSYMISYLNELIENMGKEAIDEIIRRFKSNPTPILTGVLVERDSNEYPEAYEALKQLINESGGRRKLMELCQAHPSPDIRAKMHPEVYYDGQLAMEYIFRENREKHRTLDQIRIEQLPITVQLFREAFGRRYVHIKTLKVDESSPDISTGFSIREITPEETMERIQKLAVLNDIISPGEITGFDFNGTHTILIPWKLNLKVANGRNHYTLEGNTANSGKGLTLAATSASAFMEVIERFSSWAGVTKDFPNGYVEDKTMIQATYSELKQKKLNALDPNLLSLKAPYMDWKLSWVWGEVKTAEGISKILVPAQLVFMGDNFDEPTIYGITSSNGLASGNVMEEAKLHALLEIVERDGDYTVFYSPDRCFTIDVKEDDEGAIGKILSAAKKNGIVIQILDLTTEFGIPTYRAFVKVGDQILSGSGAHLDARIAIARALGETNTKIYGLAMHNGGVIEGLSNELVSDRVVKLEELPNYSTGNVKGDLALTEEVLIKSGFTPIYVDLTRGDLKIPVVRAIVPGLEMPDGISGRQILHIVQELKRLGILTIDIPAEASLADVMEDRGQIRKVLDTDL